LSPQKHFPRQGGNRIHGLGLFDDLRLWYALPWVTLVNQSSLDQIAEDEQAAFIRATTALPNRK